MRKYEKNQVMFATVECEEAIQEARDYILKMELTAENAKIVKKDGMVLVVLKEDLK